MDTSVVWGASGARGVRRRGPAPTRRAIVVLASGAVGAAAMAGLAARPPGAATVVDSHKAHAPPIGRLSLATSETLEVYSAFDDSTAGGDDPVLAPDPADPTRSAMRCRVWETTDTHNSSWLLDLADGEYPETAPDEIYVGFSVYIDHQGPPADRLRFFEIVKREPTQNFDSVAAYVQNEGAVARWSTYTGAPSYTFPLIPKQQWTRVCVHHRRPTNGREGVIEIWVAGEDAEDMGPPVVSATHDVDWPVRGFRLRSWTTGPFTQIPGNKDVHFRKLAWGPTAQDAMWGPHNTYELQLGQVCSTADPAHVDARLHHYLELPLHGTAIDDGALVGRFQYKRAADATWLDSGAPEDYSEAIAPDPLGECVVGHTVTGLDGDTAYEFRVLVSNGSGFSYTTNVATVTTPSAAGGSPASFSFVFGSCSEEQDGTTGSAPHDSFRDLITLTPPPRAFIHVGDVCYADNVVGDLPEASDDDGFRRHLRMQVYHSMEQARVYASMATSFTRDDHEVINGWFGAGPGAPLALMAESDQAFGRYTSAARTLQPLPGVVGGDHRWWETARCLFVVSDARYHKNLDPAERTYWGAAQDEAIKQLFRDNTKPIVFWFSQTAIGTTQTAPDENLDPEDQEMCSNWQEWLDERDDIIQTFVEHNPTTARLFFCTGDRHHIIVHDTGLPDYPNVGPEYCVSPLDKVTQGGPQMVGLELYKGLGGHSVGDYVHFYTLVAVDEAGLSVDFTIYDVTDPGAPRSVIYADTHDDMALPLITVMNQPSLDSRTAVDADSLTVPGIQVAAGWTVVVLAFSADPDDAARTDGPVARFGSHVLTERLEQDDPDLDQTVHAWVGTGLTGENAVTVDWGTTGGHLDSVGAVVVVLAGVDQLAPVDVVAGASRPDTTNASVTITPTVENTLLLALDACSDTDAPLTYSARPLADLTAGTRRAFAQQQQTGPAFLPLTMSIGLDGGADGSEDHVIGAIAIRPAARIPGDANDDGVVNFTDLLVVLSAWGPCLGCPADFNGDGAVNFTDLLIMLGNWG